MSTSETNPTLPPAVLARREQLPRAVAPVVLTGGTIYLRPLDLVRDVPALHAVSNGEPIRLGTRTHPAYDAEALVWRYLSGGPFADADALAAWLRPQTESANGLCLCVLDRLSDTPVGVVNFMSNMPEHLKVELGGIWYSPIAQRTGANAEATYVMLQHAFSLGYRRVEWKCDALNARSRHAALRMGFIFEGLQQAHFIVKDRNRDTAWFRLLDTEWAAAREALQRLLPLPTTTDQATLSR